MSGLYLFVLLTVWIVVGLVIYKILLALKYKIPRVLIGLIGVVVYSAWVGWPGWEVFGKKMYWDNKVRDMCAVDGGVEVYEKIVLPEEVFDRYGNIGVPNKTQAKMTDDYYFEAEDTYLRKDNPRIIRSIIKIVRSQDNKVLGKSIRYGRGGGDLYGPWSSSSYSCPPIKELGLESSIFRKGIENE
ncbi:MAG: hypothetical protein OQL20_11860 [Sedimenticola sp.]|nr:hypothetical protein [Sedimenticola sp.]